MSSALDYGRRWRVGLAVVALAAGVALWLGQPGPSGAPSRKGRAATLLLTSSEPLTLDVNATMNASDALVARLRAQGEPDVGAAIQRRLASASVTDVEAHAFYEANRALFGARSFAQSQASIDRLLRIHKVRMDLDIPAPERGLVFP